MWSEQPVVWKEGLRQMGQRGVGRGQMMLGRIERAER
jgi:hypothetical protein